ncbi:LOB domain-containing protein 27-like [Gossypium australe]|uniref:LOB domain-containing protein 27-like n=1 Tax=Gossypium australe TaxID=47621 RepID=A0A5B6W1P8_9ROSI|nr:LOB domain-containing protein 27-like [Gossypium australe]
MTLKSGTTSACAACKYQRRKCIPECLLAPYFPADQTKVFQNAHKLFGVSNIVKILKSLDPSQHAEAMRSIKYQANVRDKFPVYGCLGVIRQLYYQIQLLEEEFHSVLSQLEMYRQYHHEVPSQLELGMAPPTNGLHFLTAVSDMPPLVIQHEVAQDYDELHPFFDTIDDRQSFIHSKEPYDSSCEDSAKETTQAIELVPNNELKNAAACFSLTSVH